jgi:hypothetical protein
MTLTIHAKSKGAAAAKEGSEAASARRLPPSSSHFLNNRISPENSV